MQAIGDYTLQRPLHVLVEKTVPQAHLQRGIAIAGQQAVLGGISPVQVFDDHTRFRQSLRMRVIADDREFAQGP
ncbi:hypothetical protein D3C84_1047710 [compost metagenome]